MRRGDDAQPRNRGGKGPLEAATGEVPVPPLDIQAIVKSHYPMAVIEVADPVSTEGYV